MERIVEHKLLEKNDFCDYIDEIVNCIDYYNDLNRIFEKYGVNGCIYPPNCAASLIRIMKIEMNVPEDVTMIEDYCFNPKRKKSTKNKDSANSAKEILSPQDLYDKLLERMENT